jgi:WD40 repeat protein
MPGPLEKTYDLFVSYAEVDRAWVEGHLLDALRAAGVDCLTPDEFELGSQLITEFERSIARSRRVLLVLSASYLADVNQQLVDCLARYHELRGESASVIPLQLSEVALPLGLESRVGLSAVTDEERLRAVERLVRELKERPPEAPGRPACPYPGMEPFNEGNAHLFKGRHVEAGELLGQVRTSRCLFVLGSSGSGKSSLVRAGVAARWREKTGPVDIIQPTAQPPTQLQALPHGDPAIPRLLVVDQFEEVFTLADNMVGEQFQQALLQWLSIPNRFLLAVVRADFYTELMESPLFECYKAQCFPVPRLRGEMLRKAIEEPAREMGVFVDPQLTQRLVHDAGDEPGILPHVQATLVSLWEDLQRRYLPLRAYEEMGGLHVAMARWAEASLLGLSEQEKVLARGILLRLVQFGEGRPDTRRRQKSSELFTLPGEEKDIRAVLARLRDNRLLVCGEVIGTDFSVDLAHEALLSGWPTLREWLVARKTAEQSRRRLEERATEYLRLHRRRSGLLNAADLAEAERFVTEYAAEVGCSPELKDLTRATRWDRRKLTVATTLLVVAALASAAVAWVMKSQADRLASDANSARQGEALEKRKVEMSLYANLIGWAAQDRDAAGTEQLEQRLARCSSELRDWEWHHLQRKAHPEQFRLPLGGSSAQHVKWCRDGSRITTLRYDLGQIWDARTGAELFRWSYQRVPDLAAIGGSPLSPNGERLVQRVDSLDRDARQAGRWSVSVIDLTTHASKVLFSVDQRDPKSPNHLTSVWWCPDSKRLASLHGDNSIKIWDVARGIALASWPNHTDETSFSSGGDETPTKTLTFSCHDRNLWIRSGASGFGGTDYLIDRILCSPDGNHLAALSQHNEFAKIWDIGRGQVVMILFEGLGHDLKSLSWSPQGHRLAVICRDWTDQTASPRGSQLVRVWEVATGKRLFELKRPHHVRFERLAWDPRGRFLATASRGYEKPGVEDRRVTLWDATTGRELRSFPEQLDFDGALAFRPDGERIATAGPGGFINLWETAGDSKQPVLRIAASPLGSLGRWNPDGRYLIAAGKVWEAESGEPFLQLKSADGSVAVADWSPDCGRLVTDDGRVWDVAEATATRRLISAIGSDATWSPDGDRLALADVGGLVEIIDSATAKLVSTFTGHTGGPLGAIAWGGDGRTLATGSADGTIRNWDATTGIALWTHQVLQGPVRFVWWSADGERLTSAGWPRTGENRIGSWTATREMRLDLAGRSLDVENFRQRVSIDAARNRLATLGFHSRDRGPIENSSDIQVWDLGSGRSIWRIEDPTAWVIGLCPDGTRLAILGKDRTGGGGRAEVWEVGAARSTCRLVDFGRADLSQVNLCWSPDGQRLALPVEGAIGIWDAKSGARIARFGAVHSLEAPTLMWCPDNQRLLVATRGIEMEPEKPPQIWNVTTRLLVQSLPLEDGEVTQIEQWSPDGRLVAAAIEKAQLGSEKRQWTVKVWDAGSGKVLSAFKDHHFGRISELWWSSDGSRLATSSYDRTAKVWDLASWSVARTFRGHQGDLPPQFLNQTSARIFGDNFEPSWEQGSRIESIFGFRSIAWSPDGKRLATLSEPHPDGQAPGTRYEAVRIWNATTAEEILVLPGHELGTDYLAWSPDGQTIATLGRRMTRDQVPRTEMKLRDANSGQELYTLEDPGEFMAFSPEGTRIAFASFGEVTIRDAGKGTQLASIRRQRPETASSADIRRKDREKPGFAEATSVLESYGLLAWSPDGNRLACVTDPWGVTAQDKSVVIFDSTTGREICLLSGLGGRVQSLLWSPNGHRLLTGVESSAPGLVRSENVKIWDTQFGQEILTLSGPSARLQWSADGRLLGSGRFRGIMTWDAREEHPQDRANGASGTDLAPASPLPVGRRRLLQMVMVDPRPPNAQRAFTASRRSESRRRSEEVQ